MGFRIAAAAILLCLAPSTACSAKDDHPSNLPMGGAAGSGAATSSGGQPTGGAGGSGGTGAVAGGGGASGGGGSGCDAGPPSLGGAAGTSVFDPTPCLGGGNIVLFDGQSGDYIHPTDDVVTQGKWSASHDANQVKISVTPSDPKQGIVWYLDFNSNALSAPLGLGVYLDAERGPFASPGHPGLEIYGDGKGCNKLSGRFQIYQLDTSCGLSFTASFEQSCETTFPVLRGCVHYQQ